MTDNFPTDEEIINKLLRFWKTDKLSIVGKVSINKNNVFFNEILINKKILKFPSERDELPIKATVFASNVKDLKNDEYYSFTAKLADRQFRVKKQNPFLLVIDDSQEINQINSIDLTEFSNESFIKNLFRITGRDPKNASTIARQLTLNELELYTQTERFIFELIQNADDMPNAKYKGLYVEFVLTDDFLILMHNGLPFERANVEAVCDAGKSTKVADTTKTGYKGIGFKSVFSDSQAVYIHSGYFTFRFDKSYELYQNGQFDALYKEHFESYPNERRVFNGKEIEYTNINSVPWQIKPIWTPLKEYPEQITKIQDVFKKEVTISLKIGREIIKSKNYFNILNSLFSEPRFLLFLRNVRNITYKDQEGQTLISVLRNGYFKNIEAIDNRKEEIKKVEYITDRGESYQINIDNDNLKKADIPLEITNEFGKVFFKDFDGNTVKGIPEKLANLGKTTISFAAEIENKKIKKLDLDDSILFNYLPTGDKRFGFPFLVNADFITNSSREFIQNENSWNHYLFYNIGYSSILWLSDLVRQRNIESEHSKKLLEIQPSVLNLLPKRFKTEGEIYESFNRGYDKAIMEIAFLPSSSSHNLLYVSEAILDKTGIFESSEMYAYFKLLHPSKELVHYNLSHTTSKLCKIEDYGFEVITFEETDICKLYELDDFPPSKQPDSNSKFILYLQRKKVANILATFPSILNHKGILAEPTNLFYGVDNEDKEAIIFDNTIELLHPTLEELSVKNQLLNHLLYSDLGVKLFNPAIYIDEILQNINSINSNITTLESNRKFWQFIFKYRKQLSENTKKKLCNCLIYITEEGIQLLKDCYLSSSFDTTYDIEGVSQKLELKNMYFVSITIADERNKSEWRSFLNDCGVRTSEGYSLYQHEIKRILKNNGLTEINYLTTTRFVFDVYTNNLGKFTSQDELKILSSIPLKTVRDGLQLASVCIFAEIKVNEFLPDSRIENQVEIKHYSNENRENQAWKEFFLKLNVKELNQNEIVKKKIDLLANKVTQNNTIEIWRILYKNQEHFLEDATYKNKVKGFPILLKNKNLAYLNNNSLPVYFSNEYLPSSEIEDLLSGYYDYFMSTDYCENPDDYSNWKDFFKKFGVLQRISTSGTVNNLDFLHTSNLTSYDFALKFWVYLQENFKLEEISPNCTFIRNAKQSNTIPCNENLIMRKPCEVFALELRDKIKDESKISKIDFHKDWINLLGIISEVNEDEIIKDNSYLKYIGNLGEKFVYNDFKTNYENKGQLEETENGFIVLDKKGDEIAIIIWNNKALVTDDIKSLDDSGLPYDFKIIEEEKELFIEVKSTLNQKNIFHMPESEWNFMLNNNQNYYVYRVINVTDNANIDEKFLAFEALMKGKIKPKEFPVEVNIG